MAGKNEFLHRVSDSFFGVNLNPDKTISFYQKSPQFKFEDYNMYKEHQMYFSPFKMLEKVEHPEVLTLASQLLPKNIQRSQTNEDKSK